MKLLKIHLPLHGGLRFIRGENCDRVFNSLNSYLKHLKSIHKGGDSITGMSNNTIVTLCGDNSVDFSEDSGLDSNIDHNIVENVNSVLELSSEDFKASYSKSVEILIAKFYKNPSIPRNFVQTLIGDLKLFLNGGFIDILESKVVSAFNESEVPQSKVDEIKDIFKCIMNPFEGLHSDYKRMEHFKANKYYVAPVTFTISERRPKPFKTREGVVVKYVKTTGQFIPFRHVLQNLFELPGALSATLISLLVWSRATIIASTSPCSALRGSRSFVYRPAPPVR